jgi:hypothetical protein
MNNFAFVPLQTVSPEKAELVVEKKRAYLRDLEGCIPLGLYKQYEIQIKYLENSNAADIELMACPIYAIPLPHPERPYITIAPSVVHPWSRGTIVSSSSQ